MSSGENLTINDNPIINSPLTSSPLLSAPVSAPLTSSPSNDELVLYDQGEGEIVGQNYIFNGTIATAGTYTFQTQLKSTSNWSSHMSIYINGAEVHRFSKAGADGYSNLLTYNITLQAGDSVSLYIFHDLSGESCYCKSTKIYTLVPVPPTPSNVRYSSGLYYNGVKYEWGKAILPRTPGANTYAYYEFEQNYNDLSGYHNI